MDMSTPVQIHVDLSCMYTATRFVLLEATKLARLAHGWHPREWSTEDCACAAAHAAMELGEQLVNARKMVTENAHYVRAAHRALNLPAARIGRLVYGIYSSAHEAAI